MIAVPTTMPPAPQVSVVEEPQRLGCSYVEVVVDFREPLVEVRPEAAAEFSAIAEALEGDTFV